MRKCRVRESGMSGTPTWQGGCAKKKQALRAPPERFTSTEVLLRKKLPETLRRRAILFFEIAEDALEYSRRYKRSYRDDESRMKRLKEWFGASEAESLAVQEIENRLCSAAASEKW